MIPEEVIQDVLERTDIVRLVGATVDLRKAGTVYKGLCPFHDEKTPSFIVTPVRRTYHCFGCQAHGDAIRWMVEHERLTFPEAVRNLAASCGVEVPEARRETPAQREAREHAKSETARLLSAQDKVAAYYTEMLFGPAGQRARRYLESRGVTRAAAEAFRLGWAGGDKRRFGQFLEGSGIQRDDLHTLGIMLRPDEGWDGGRPLDGGYLRFRERLMFPIVDVRGEVTGFSGRILDPKAKAAKYVNSPETPVFTKGEQLYGAYTARSTARRAGRLVLVEGQVDVVMLWQAGLEGTAAAMGTALTPKQVRLVKRLADHVVCVMDGDAAGAKAAFASLVPFLEAGMQPRAVMLPQGEDPDSFVRAMGIETFRKLLDQASPLLDLYVERVSNSHPNDPPGRAAALHELVPALSKLQEPVTRKLYVKHVCTALSVDPELVEEAIAGRAERAPRTPAPTPGFDPGPPPPEAFTGMPDPRPRVPVQTLDSVPGYELQFVGIIVQYPHLSGQIDLDSEDYSLTHPGLAAFLRGLHDEVCAGRTPNEDHILKQMGDSQAVTFVRDWQAKRPSLVDETVAHRAFEEALRRLRRGRLSQLRARLVREALTVQGEGDVARASALMQQANSIRPDKDPEGVR